MHRLQDYGITELDEAKFTVEQCYLSYNMQFILAYAVIRKKCLFGLPFYERVQSESKFGKPCTNTRDRTYKKKADKYN